MRLDTENAGAQSISEAKCNNVIFGLNCAIEELARAAKNSPEELEKALEKMVDTEMAVGLYDGYFGEIRSCLIDSVMDYVAM